MTDAPDGGFTLDASVTDKGDASQLVVSRYVPPLDGSKDELYALDMQIARAVGKELLDAYPGYPWHVIADSKQGIVMFSMPLMGPTLKYVIRLGEFADLTPKLIRICAGELLERIGLRRGAIDLAQYYAAKNAKHTFDFSDVRSK